ncbi:TRAP transporter small permease [Desulfobacula sp.]|uniref:TRAP transporter small permease n=1 Tax=Desulfobacula sp. TaxID=2593537 RepID=UPI0026209966|nr:TRAP transporter small permease [Desulfobacula sp.]
MKAVVSIGRNMGKAINQVCQFGHLLGEIAVLILLLMVSYTVVMRYFFNNPPIWTEEIGCYLFIFIIWISVGGVLKEDRHITFDLVFEYISPNTQIWLKIVTSFVGLLFCVVLAWYATRYTFFQYQFNLESSTLLSMPLWIPYMTIPVGGIIISLQFLVKIAGYFSFLSGQKNKQKENMNHGA